jgi:hypothetical protein
MPIIAIFACNLVHDQAAGRCAGGLRQQRHGLCILYRYHDQPDRDADGGTCYGDSGGPNFFGSGSGETKMLAGTTITGDTPCVQSNVIYRLDTPSARAFLMNFVALP